MQFFKSIILLAGLAAAAPAASDAGSAPAIEARAEVTQPCTNGAKPWWNNGQGGYGDGGWGCYTDFKGGCRAYYWKTDLPYWSC
ncbi:hypothetical protein C8035_v005009 [Colletotrichum spinosum]|uniref:Secreted protein n=1 Tax=Colletotrichum spinosum TaxID=1347390 RepID=A0A4R8PVP8_9PEZI|nr:hypothetical protein C8035_v005009 [Colletotrichum spinosum]